MKQKTKTLALYAVGIALFVVLSLCLQVPVFENYYLCLGYVVMAVYCYSFGTGAGTVVGFFGVILYCVVISGLRGMPGWALGNLVIGLALGSCFKATREMKPPPAPGRNSGRGHRTGHSARDPGRQVRDREPAVRPAFSRARREKQLRLCRGRRCAHRQSADLRPIG